MRKILLALVLVAGLGVSGYAQVNRSANLTTGSKIGPLVNGVVTPVDERGAGITQHIIVWNVVGTVSGCSVKLEQSATGTGSWTDLIAGATCTSNGTSALTTGTANFVRINATTLTGTGTLAVRYIAFPPGQALTATVDTTGLATGVAQGSTTSGELGTLVQCAVTTSAPTYTTAQTSPLSCDTTGGLRTSGGGGGTQYTQDAALTVATSVGTMSMGRASAAVPTGVSADDDAVLPWYLRSGAQAVQLTNSGVLTLSGSGTATGALRVELPTNGTGVIATVGTITNAVTVTDGAGALNVICDSGCSGGVQYTQDAALTVATSVGTMAMGRASAAVPTDVSADNDAVMPWYLRSGAVAVQLTNAGVLSLSGSGTATAALRVELANNGTGRMATLDTVTAVTTVSTVTTVSSVTAVGTITPGTAATSLGKAIDNAAGATDTVVATGCIRDDALTTLTPVDGDYVNCRTNATGAVWVQSSIIDAIEGAAVATNPVPSGCVYRSSPGTLDTGDVGYPLCGVDGRFSINTAQINGITVLMGNGVTGTGSQRVTIASDNTAFAVNATLSAETTKVIGTARVLGNAGAAFDAAAGAAPPANTVYVGGLTSGATGGFLTGIPVCDSQFNINIATATTTLAVTGVSGRHVRICGIDMVTAAANNVGIISGTGATCGTGSAAIVGTTAATGYNFAANAGIATGSGLGMIKRTVATGDSVCIITSASTQLSGTITYTIY